MQLEMTAAENMLRYLPAYRCCRNGSLKGFKQQSVKMLKSNQILETEKLIAVV